MNLFMDTNILLDVLAKREPFFPEAEHIWTLAESDRLRGFISAISFNNCYYIVRKAAGRKQADQAVRLLRDVFHLVPLNERILTRAIDAGFGDFEDAIQYHSALAARAACLLTRNTGDYPAVGLPVLTPGEFLATQSFPEKAE